MTTPGKKTIAETTKLILKSKNPPHTSEEHPYDGYTELCGEVRDKLNVSGDTTTFDFRFQKVIRRMYPKLGSKAAIREVDETLTYWFNEAGEDPEFDD